MEKCVKWGIFNTKKLQNNIELRFYCVDVNTVPHKLVARAAVTKMPTIQLWKDSKKQAEVIGGHKAYFVVNELKSWVPMSLSPKLAFKPSQSQLDLEEVGEGSA
ncbi:Thioredoxin-like 3-2, chloroplastic [Vitis vinifera]|uniref:Thioredoxin-like 3-2, chloroplastic n=1 Tax=Vitis vinifera TaxID=29760 RepID=A0A438GPN6_VITVI|nr:Thioredoxin-like 3-2, chloroplastic [Vitis vinifera]